MCKVTQKPTRKAHQIVRTTLRMMRKGKILDQTCLNESETFVSAGIGFARSEMLAASFSVWSLSMTLAAKLWSVE